MKVKDGNLQIFNKKKITGTTVMSLAGLDKFNKPGDTILSMLGYIYEDIDPFYVDRGALGEKFALRFLSRNHKCVIYDKKECNYDNFPENQNFGGLIDIEIPDEKTLYEIKTKNVKDYDKIVQNGDKLQEGQAMHYGWLRGYETVHIMWIFFDDVAEAEIKEKKPLSTLRNLKMFEKELILDYNYLDEIHNKALDYYNRVLITGIIPVEDINKENLEKALKGGIDQNRKGYRNSKTTYPKEKLPKEQTNFGEILEEEEILENTGQNTEGL